jgi:ribonucleoside-diphosphate reductase alpha chain
MGTIELQTAAGYRLQPAGDDLLDALSADHRAVRRRAADIKVGDILQLPLGGGFGTPRLVPMPVADQAYYTNDGELRVPDSLSPELAELVGYFMGDGSLHAKGIRLCVAAGDVDVAESVTSTIRDLFGLGVHETTRQGYIELAVHSVRLARWWVAAGFGKCQPSPDHVGKGWTPHIPAAVMESQDDKVVAAFLRGLYEADGTVTLGGPCVSTVDAGLADQVRSALLRLGVATTTGKTTSGRGSRIHVIRTRNVGHAAAFRLAVGFIGVRKAALVQVGSRQTAKRDLIYLPADQWISAAPVSPLPTVRQSLQRAGGVPRAVAGRVLGEDHPALGFLYERVEACMRGRLHHE